MASAQNGIMSPLLLGRKILEYIYPSEEAVNTVEAAPANYKKGLTNELLQRQAYKESTFNPAAVSPAGYKGLTQIGEGVLEDYSNKKGGKKLDPFNPKDAVELQKFAMNDLYNASFINKPEQSDSVRIAKTLAAYNWGRGNLANYLNEQKSKGIDIYDSYDWLNNLPKETSDYVNKILLQEDPSFNKNYKKASTNPKYEEVTSLYNQKKFGGDIPSAQNGQEMRFYQNGLDWKPKSMQGGGEQPLRVSTSDPRYPELYKNRQVGAYYDGAYSLPDLPEVVVTGKDESLKEAMSQGSGKFLQGLAGVMGAPQAVTMELLTGKQQTPSEAFGFQQAGGWLDSPSSFGKNASNLAMDVVLDPLNALGVGVADDLFRTGVKKITKDVLNNPLKVSEQASEQLLKNQNFPRSVSELTNTGFKKDPHFHYDAFRNKKRNIVDKLNTNEGRRRLENLVLNNPHLQSLNKTTDDLIYDFENTIFETSSPVYDPQLNDWKRHSDGSLVREPVNPDNAYNWYRRGYDEPSFVSMGMNYTPYDASHILEHEFAHAFQRGNELSGIDDVLGNIELKPYFETSLRERIANLNPFNKNYDKGYSESGKIYGTGFDNASRDRALSNSKYYFSTGSGRGQEKAAFSAEVRENLMQRGLLKDRYDEITPEMLKKHYDLYKNTKGNKYNLRLYDIMTGNKENFSYLSEALNRLPAMVPPSALPYVGLGGAGYAGIKGLEEQKYGGVIKDNRGQWAHPGEVTEIDSNYITMEGVPYDVVGVSDAGDTKLMKPGKNYKFKGKKVTEFPVAQYGKGIPFKDAVNNPKDPADPIRKDLAPPIRPKASFEEQKRIAKLELDKYGYTSDQRKSYVKGKSEKAFRNIVPQGYGDLTQTLDRINRYEKDLGRNPDETIWFGAEDSSTGKPIYYDLPKRDDAFALYLGLPQKNKSFGISEYQPGDSKENKYYFKPNYLDENLKNRLVASYFDNVDDDSNVYIANERLDAFRQKTDSLRRAGVPDENPIYANWIVDNPLGDFKMSKGKDKKGHYISIYDQWDLNPFKQGEGASSNAAAATLKTFAKMK
jgi:hypothetical protein